jgi:hypothetical protein
MGGAGPPLAVLGQATQPPPCARPTGRIDAAMDLMADRKVPLSLQWTEEVSNGTAVAAATGVLGTANVHVDTAFGDESLSGDLQIVVVAGRAERVTVAAGAAEEVSPYATFSGFRSGSDRPHVMVTQDGGRTWTDISPGLPDAPVNSVIPTSDGLLVVGTDVGVYVSAWNGGEWAALGTNLPMAAVMYLRYHEPTRQLTAATFGRGVYDVVLPRCPAATPRLPLHVPGVGVVGALASCKAS